MGIGIGAAVVGSIITAVVSEKQARDQRKAMKRTEEARSRQQKRAQELADRPEARRRRDRPGAAKGGTLLTGDVGTQALGSSAGSARPTLLGR